MSRPYITLTKRPRKRKGPSERCNARRGRKLQSFGGHCNSDNHRKERVSQACIADFASTPLGRAAEVRERVAVPYHVQRLADRQGLSLSLAGTIAELAGIGPREVYHGC